MGIQKDFQVFKALRVSVLALGVVISLSSSRPARAETELDSCSQDAKDARAALKEQENAAKIDLESKNAALALLMNPGSTDEDMPELGGACDCLPKKSVGCNDAFWTGKMKVSVEELAGLSEEPYGGCLRIYKAFAGSMDVNVSEQCLKLVGANPADDSSSNKGCGKVRREILIKKTNAAIKKIPTSEQFSQKRKEITQTLKECRKDCADCKNGGASGGAGRMGPREPGFGDYLIGGLQAITPMVMGGIGAWEYNKGLNSYTSNYGNYLNQCTTVGVPCGGPMPIMGGFGGGMGGFSMMGGGGFGGGMGGMMMGGGIFAGGGMMMGGGGGYPMMGGGMGGMMMGGGIFAGGGMMMGGGGGYPMMGGGMGGMMMGGGIFAGGGMMMGGGGGYPMMGGGMGGMMMGGGIFAGGGMMMGGGGGMYGPGMGGFTAGYGMPAYPYGTGFSSPMFAMGPVGGMMAGGGIFAGGGIGMGGGYPYGGGGMGMGYPYGGGGIGMGGGYPYGGGGGGYPYAGGGGYPYGGGGGAGYGGGYPGVAPGGFMGPGAGGYGFASGGGGYGYAGGGYNPQYGAMQQASMQQSILQAQNSAQSQQDLMIAQQQIYQAQSRYYQASSGGGYGYGGGGGVGGARPF